MLLTKVLILFMIFFKMNNGEPLLKKSIVVIKDKGTALPKLNNNLKKSIIHNFAKILETKYKDLAPENCDMLKLIMNATDLGRNMEPQSLRYYDRAISDIIKFDDTYYTTDNGTTNELASTKNCDKYDDLLNKHLESPEYKKMYKIYEPLMTEISTYAKVKINTFSALEKLVSSIDGQDYKKWPFWIPRIHAVELYEAACYSYGIPTGNKELARLSVGNLINEIFETIATNDIPEDPTPIKLYSADSYTIVGILNALNLRQQNDTCPEEYSAIFFEGFTDNKTGAKYVKILYRNVTSTQTPFTLNIPDCGDLCPIDEFAKIYDYLFPLNRDAECNPDYILSNAQNLSLLIVMLIIFTIGLLPYISAHRQYTTPEPIEMQILNSKNEYRTVTNVMYY